MIHHLFESIFNCITRLIWQFDKKMATRGRGFGDYFFGDFFFQYL